MPPMETFCRDLVETMTVFCSKSTAIAATKPANAQVRSTLLPLLLDPCANSLRTKRPSFRRDFMSSPLSQQEKQRLYDKAKEKLIAWYGSGSAGQGACLYWTQVGLIELQQAGFRVVLQAGQMSWPMVAPELDDGRIATHFSYMWSPDTEQSHAAIAAGKLPEMHTWVALPITGELVDFSTGLFPTLARDRCGAQWTAAPPPLFLWGRPPDGVIYRPNRQATLYADRFLRES
jgi:hypothetical protein